MITPSALPASPLKLALAWGVHALTASGAVVGVLALHAVAAGDLPRAALLMLVALAIDSVDGSMARAVGVGEILPRIDGRRLDDIVDYVNYVIVPAAFMLAAGSVSHLGFVALPVLASAFGFSRTDAKTEDDFFLGFPSYWNVIALYLWLLGLSPEAGSAIVTLFALLVFVPFKYVYPSKLRVLGWTTNGLAALWIIGLAWIVTRPERAAELRLVELSLLYPAWYLGLSFWLGGLRRTA